MSQPYVWFPEVNEALQAEWTPHLGWDELIALRDRLAVDVAEAHQRTGAPMLWCTECCAYNSRPILRVSAIIAQTAYLGLQSHQDARRQRRRWARQRRKRGLDVKGRPIAQDVSGTGHHPPALWHDEVVRRDRSARPGLGGFEARETRVQASAGRQGTVADAPVRRKKRKPW